MMAVGSEHQPPSATVTALPVATAHAAVRQVPKTVMQPDMVKLVIARSVQGEQAVEVSQRFLSPAMRLWAVVTLTNVRATDKLRFVFQRNGVTLPHDDITILAGDSMGKYGVLAVQSFKVWADYDHGAAPLPAGNYRLLFYKNGHLDGHTAFRVG
jgi:hypothetical protein